MKKTICTITLFASLWLSAALAATTGSFTQVASQNLASGTLSFTSNYLSTQGLYLASVGVHFSAAPASSETVTIAIASRNGSSFDTELIRTTTVAGTTTDLTFLFNGSIPVSGNDQIKVTCTNVSLATTVSASILADGTARSGYGITLLKDGVFSVVFMPGGSSNWADLTTGTNTTATMTVGTGATLTVSGTGSVNATKFNGNAVVSATDGGTGSAPTGDDYLPIASSSSAIAWKAIPNCTDSSGNHLNYTTASNALSCGTSKSTVVLTTDVSGTLPVANGGTNLTAAADDNVMVGDGTTWATKAVPNCTDTTGQHLNYTTSTNAFSCGTTYVAKMFWAGGSANGSLNTSSTNYMSGISAIVSSTTEPTGTADSRWFARASITGTYKNMSCIVDVAPGAGKSWAITLRRIGAGNTAITCTIADAATTCSDSVNVATPPAMAPMVYQVVPASTPAGAIMACSVEFDG